MSMSMRVTQAGSDLSMINILDNNLSALDTLQQQVSSGKAINLPSDNPGGTATALELNAQIARFQQYQANATDAASWLDTADSAIGTVHTSLLQVQTDLLAGANASGTDATTRASLAQQVSVIKQTLLTQAATSYQGRSIFSGTWNTDPYANAAAGDYTYTGSPKVATRTVGPGQAAPIGVTADQVFGTGTGSVFALLDQISSDLASGNTSSLSGADLTNLKAAMDRATEAQSQVGAWSAQLTQTATQLTSKVTALQGSVSSIVDVDEASAASKLQLQEVAYQASLQTTAKIIQPSLVNFLS